MAGGSLVHMYRSDEARDRGKSLCGLLENPGGRLSEGDIGTRKTVNCSPCIDAAQAQGIITTPGKN